LAKSCAARHGVGVSLAQDKGGISGRPDRATVIHEPNVQDRGLGKLGCVHRGTNGRNGPKSSEGCLPQEANYHPLGRTGTCHAGPAAVTGVEGQAYAGRGVVRCKIREEQAAGDIKRKRSLLAPREGQGCVPEHLLSQWLQHMPPWVGKKRAVIGRGTRERDCIAFGILRLAKEGCSSGETVGTGGEKRSLICLVSLEAALLESWKKKRLRGSRLLYIYRR